MILTIKTDQPLAEVGLYNNLDRIDYEQWQAHRELSATLHKKIEDILTEAGFTWQDITGVVFYEGPGSFTGLRIGAAVANAVASQGVPVANSSGDKWIEDGISKLEDGGDGAALPAYGSAPHITLPKK